MRIFDNTKNESLTNIMIMLNSEELHELIDSLNSLDAHNEHVHMDDSAYKRQITIGVYSNQDMQKFSPEVIKLIQED